MLDWWSKLTGKASDTGLYKVKPGDTLSQIAKRHNLGTSELLKANRNIADPNKIRAGQVINVPNLSDMPTNSTPETTPSDFEGDKVDLNNSILPINIRQILNPTEDRTNVDFSQEELDAFKRVYEYSQTPEARKAKMDAGKNPDTIQYMDYNAFEGMQSTDAAQGANNTFKFSKLTDPVFNLKTTLGKVSAPTVLDDGTLEFTDIYDFPAKTNKKGVRKLGQYLGSVPDAGFNPYRQVRNFMGYYGPQEGDGTGGEIKIRIPKES
jgi:murein DD-endopeptidase MepM/ murein hydrolase activator NlpD|tara:strand:+ start:208 stop:1002 length:795 start_codon:yes stop_codon:yes gene_type:complete